MRAAIVIAALAAAGTAAFAESPAPPQRAIRISLAEALARTRENSPRLAQLEALSRAASAASESADVAAQPQLDLTAGYSRLSSVPEFAVRQPGQGVVVVFPDLQNQWRSRAQLSVPLYTGGRIASQRSAAAREVDATGQDRSAGEADLLLESSAAYWFLVASRENERVLKQALATYDAHLVDARHRLEFGLAAPNEVYAIEAERENAELMRLNAATNSTVAEANLARLLGLPRGTHIEPTDPLDVPGGTGVTCEQDLDAQVARALDARPERKALLLRWRAAEERAAAQDAARRPQVAFAAGYDYANPNKRIVPNEDSWRGTWDASVFASWSVFDGGRTKSAVAEARAKADATKNALLDLERRVQLEVTQRCLETGNARASIGVAESGIRSADENRRVAANRYREGVAVSSELLDAETALLRAGLSRTQALVNLHVAEAALARAVGSER